MKPPLFTQADVEAAEREIEEAMAAARGYVAAEARQSAPAASALRGMLMPEGRNMSPEFAGAAIRLMWLVPVVAFAMGALLGDLNADAAWLAAPGVVLAAALVMAATGKASRETVSLGLCLHCVSVARLAAASSNGGWPVAVAAVAAAALAAAALWRLFQWKAPSLSRDRIDPDFGDFHP